MLSALTRQSLNRLKDRLDEFGYDGIWQAEYGYIMRLVAARQVFLSADESSNVVGHTADLLLEVDESQDINQAKYSKEFRPMASSTNATTVHYGTTWDDGTLLEQTERLNLDRERFGNYKTAFDFYNGSQWERQSNNRQLVLNYAKITVDKVTSFQVNEINYSFKPVPGAGAAPSATRPPTLKMSSYFFDVIARSQQSTKQSQGAVSLTDRLPRPRPLRRPRNDSIRGAPRSDVFGGGSSQRHFWGGRT